MIRNMDFNYATILLITILYLFFHIQYDMSTISSKYFRHLLGSVWLTAFFNIAADYMALHRGNISDHYINLIYAVYAFVLILSPYSLSQYTKILVRKDKKMLIDYLNNAILIIHIIVCLATIRHSIFYVIEDNLIEKGELYSVLYVLSGYYLAVSLLRLIINLKKLSNRQIHGVFSCILIGGVGAVFQYMLFGSNIVIYYVYAVAATILLFTFETPDYQKLLTTTAELTRSKEELEKVTAKSAELTQTIHELMKSASWVVYFDENKNITESSWSPQFKTMLGYCEDDEVDINALWQDSLHPEEKDYAVECFMNGLTGKEYKIEARLRSKDGSYKWYLCTGEIKKDEKNNVLSYQGVIKDIEDEKYMEKLVEEKQKALDELEKSQDELKSALFEAQEASKAKTIFLSNMSHDIRTPMNAVVGYTQIAQSNLDNKEEIRESLEIIRSSGEHLLSLINDVLDMSRIESGKVRVEESPCNLESVMSELSNMIKSKVDEKNQTYETCYESLVDKYVLCDRLRLNQILINCIGNSVKYTPEKGNVKVSLMQKPSDKEGYVTYVFKVSDTGIGMSQEFLARIFEPFERAENSTTSQIQGTGLGMAITKNLVDMMGGTIEAASELGKGSEFIISIPFKTISCEEYEKSVDMKNNIAGIDEMTEVLAGRHFLVVDDNKLNRSIVRRLLEQKNMSIEEASSGLEVIARIEKATEGEIDIVFMDIQMPGMTGYEATDKIRQLDNPVAKSIPIIAMTANAFEEDKRMAREHGMAGHVTKPFKIDELVETLYSILYAI